MCRPEVELKKRTHNITLGVVGVFIGCGLNALSLEYLVKADPGCGTLATFVQYITIVLVGYFFTSKFYSKKRNIPIRSYSAVVSLFYVANVANNYVFKFYVSMPLHMIFRSASLITNMLMGIVVLKRKYSLLKFFSVGLITLGVLICTLITGQEMKEDSSKAVGDDGFFWWMIGISILVIILFVSSGLGICQEKLVSTHGKHPDEALFHTHLLALPGFLFFYQDIVEHFGMALRSPDLVIPLLNMVVPSSIFYLAANAITQYIGIKSVYLLTTESSSLAVTLVLTLRKFSSIIFSIVYFDNTFTLYHWVGTLCVFIGTLIFTEIPQKMFKPKKKAE